jgi:hypothetical protein
MPTEVRIGRDPEATPPILGQQYQCLPGATVSALPASFIARCAEEIEMPDIGDRVEVASKAGARFGVVTGVSGAMITVRWDAGGETSLIPGPGVLSVVAPGATAGSHTGGTKKSVAKKSTPAKKSAAKGSSSGRTTGRKRR